MSVASYTKSGSKASTPVKLDKKVFGVAVTDFSLLKLAYQAYLANGRTNLAKTKKRGEVRGGGRKPIRQKGTGYARVGSTRNPLQTGGGVTFGPTGEENYSINLNSKSKRQALRQALSLASRSEKISIIEDFTVASGKTKDAASLLHKMKLTGRILIVIDDKPVQLVRATNNLDGVKAVQAKYLNVFDVLNADCLLISKKALEALSEAPGGAK